MAYSFLRYDKDGVLLDIEAFEDESILKDWSYLFEGKQVHSVDDSFILHLKIFCYDVISKYLDSTPKNWKKYTTTNILSVAFKILSYIDRVKEWQKDKDTACILFCACETRTSITVPIEIKNIIKKVGEKLRKMED